MHLNFFFLQKASTCQKILMQKIVLKIFNFQAVTFDLSKPDISKNEKSPSILRPRETKNSVLQSKTFLYVR